MAIIESPLGPIDEVPPLNFHTFCFEESTLRPISEDHVQHVDGITGEQRTFSEFLERVRDGATALAADPAVGGLGIKPRSDPQEIIAIFAPNCMDYIALFHSCLVLTVPCALIPSHATISELVYFMQKCDATRLFVHPSLLHQALVAAEEACFSSDKIYLLEGRSEERAGYSTCIEKIRENKVPRHPVEDADVDTLAYLVFSSGTSGKPKAVMATHGNLNFTLLQFITLVLERYQIRPRAEEDKPVIVCYRAFCHVYALHYFMLRSFIIPQTCIILPEWDIERVLDLVPKYKVSFMPLVPFQIQELIQHPKTLTTDLSSIEVIGSGSAYLHPETAKKFMHMVSKEKTESGKLAIDDGYALSESTITNIARLDTVADSLKPVPPSGILLAGQQARLVREDGTDCDTNEPGELWLRGGNIMPGYYKDEDATKSTITPDGWLRTGDVLRMDENGVFFFIDRLKDTFKVHGGQVSPAELEETILGQPDNLVADVAVAGVLSSRLATTYNTPRAWIVLNAAGRALGEEEVVKRLQTWTQEHLSHYKWIHGGIVPIESIPRNGIGKVLRRVLKQEYEQSVRDGKVAETAPVMAAVAIHSH